MALRTDRHSVAFRFPFSLRGFDGLQPAGTYTIETEEELHGQLLFTAYHRISTSIVLPLPGSGSGSYQMMRIDPADLEAAQLRDAECAAAM